MKFASDFDGIRDIVMGPDGLGVEPAPAALAARQACMDLAYGIFALTDFGRAAGALELYGENILMDLDGMRMDRAARVARSQGRQANTGRRTRHQVTNFLFRMTGERTAYAISLVAIYLENDTRVQGAPPVALADCADRYERGADGRWAVAYRCLRTVAGAAH